MMEDRRRVIIREEEARRKRAEEEKKIGKELLLDSFKHFLEQFELRWNIKILEISPKSGGFTFRKQDLSNTDSLFDASAEVFAQKILRHLKETNGVLPEGYRFSQNTEKTLLEQPDRDATDPSSQTDLK